MGILDALRSLTRPYEEDEDFFEDEETYLDEEEQPAKGASKSGSNSIFSTDTPEYETPEAEAEEPAPAPAARPSFIPRRSREHEPRSTRMPPAQAGNKIVFVKPEQYEDTKAVYDHLRSGRIVLMSLDETNKETARRILDFMAGAVYASGGKIGRASAAAYIITPRDVDMQGGDMMDELESSGAFF